MQQGALCGLPKQPNNAKCSVGNACRAVYKGKGEVNAAYIMLIYNAMLVGNAGNKKQRTYTVKNAVYFINTYI